MSNIYMYPKNDYKTLESPNPYVQHLETTLSKRHTIINPNPNKKGVVDLFFYLFRADIFFFNWIEDISIKKYGKIQSLLFPVFLIFSKLLKKKIVWVLHNKFSHERTNRGWIIFGFKLMIKYSDLILTHSNAGVVFVNDKFPRHSSKVKYIIHPVDKILKNSIVTQKKYDLLIWGTIHPYKGVIEFLKFAKKSSYLKKINIMVSGKCPDPEERSQLNSLITENIVHIDEFQSIEEITKLAKQSKFVLFTYNSESILSSGSLMDSIRMGSVIIGPNKGAFMDLQSYSFIETFTSHEEIANIIKNHIFDDKKNNLEIENFCKQNTWDLFGDKLFEKSNGVL